MSGKAPPRIVRWDMAAVTRFEDMRAAAYQNPAQRLVAAGEVRAKEYPAMESFIEGIVLEGLTILGGKPKMGKSFLTLSAAVAVSTGGVAFGNPEREVHQARTLYLGLEDGERRLSERLKIVSPPTQELDGMMLGFSWPTLDGMGASLLGQAIDEYGFRLVVVDPLSRARVPKRGRDSYQEDVSGMALIHEVTRDRPGLGIVVVHHTRKDLDVEDFVDHLSGTTGLTAVPDHVAVLQRGRGEGAAVLRLTSRDVEEKAIALSFNGGNWQELGSAAGMDLSKPRRAVLDALEELGGRSTGKEISEKAGRNASTTLELLRGLASDGMVYQDDKGGPWVLR